jgi:hypothetical protein
LATRAPSPRAIRHAWLTDLITQIRPSPQVIPTDRRIAALHRILIDQ